MLLQSLDERFHLHPFTDHDEMHGLGTHIIRDVMDTESYEASPEGNRFVATKRLRKAL